MTFIFRLIILLLSLLVNQHSFAKRLNSLILFGHVGTTYQLGIPDTIYDIMLLNDLIA